jgi:hypothetical protein
MRQKVAMTRDPRIDPRPGDVVALWQLKRIKRYVSSAGLAHVLYYFGGKCDCLRGKLLDVMTEEV